MTMSMWIQLEALGLSLLSPSDLSQAELDTIKAYVTAPPDQIKALNASQPVEAVFIVTQKTDFSGAGSKSDLKISGAQISFSLVQSGKQARLASSSALHAPTGARSKHRRTRLES